MVSAGELVTAKVGVAPGDTGVCEAVAISGTAVFEGAGVVITVVAVESGSITVVGTGVFASWVGSIVGVSASPLKG